VFTKHLAKSKAKPNPKRIMVAEKAIMGAKVKNRDTVNQNQEAVSGMMQIAKIVTPLFVTSVALIFYEILLFFIIIELIFEISV